MENENENEKIIFENGEAGVSFTLPLDLRNKFKSVCALKNKTMTNALIDFIKSQVE
jgi:hypothetical protein